MYSIHRSASSKCHPTRVGCQDGYGAFISSGDDRCGVWQRAWFRR